MWTGSRSSYAGRVACTFSMSSWLQRARLGLLRPTVAVGVELILSIIAR
jgi:hypothetical protein